MDKILYKIKKIIPKKLFKALQPFYHFSLNALAALIYSFPSEKMIVIGVTGTTGKTTTVYLIAKMLQDLGIKVGYTSTAMFGDGEKEWLNDKKMTMIGRFFTQRILSKMHKNACQVAIVETTSEGVEQFRHRFINYDILLFTGLYPEHIDSHGSFENYKRAKGKLFAHLKKCKTKYINEKMQVVKSESGLKKIENKRFKKTIIVNGNDEHANYFFDFWAERKIVFADFSKKVFDFSLKEDDFKVGFSDVKNKEQGISFVVNGKSVDFNLLGEFNAFNLSGAYAVGLALDFAENKIIKALQKIKGVPGRLEKIDEGQNFTVIVDYAFEPNAVEKLYKTVLEIPHNKIIHILGSTGGGRDIARRPILGELAGKNADYIIVTNEDPYDDDPEIIMDQVALGAEKAGKKKNKNLFKILDRKKAIEKAVKLAKKGDVLLITGKGSEQAICVAGGERIKWDDREVAREVIKRLVL